jgi:D-alanine-D-alanine ligase
MSSRTKPRVAVLKGGLSAEREVSLVSGRECASALRAEGYDVTEIDAGADLSERLRDLRPDVAFNALHGRWGEDGCVQGMLEWLRIPYTHSGVLASALAMDKERTKAVYRRAGLPVAESWLLPSADLRKAHPLPPPYVVKPYNEGSSVGVYLVPEGANRPPSLAADAPEIMMVETFVPGREMTVAVMGDRALTVTDIFTDGWYDYHAKYAPGGSRHEVPAQIPGEVFEACMDHALRAHQALGLRGLSRTDFRWDDTRGLAGLILLETNTQPGMTPTSLAPEQAALCGISFGQLCAWLVEDASCAR